MAVAFIVLALIALRLRPFAISLLALIGLGLFAQYWLALAVGVFLVGASSSAISPAIQTRLMDVARDSQSIAAALNHSALNIGNSLGAYLGGAAIAAGLGYRAPVWVGLVLTALGLVLAIGTFALDRLRSARGIPLPGHTGGIATITGGIVATNGVPTTTVPTRAV